MPSWSLTIFRSTVLSLMGEMTNAIVTAIFNSPQTVRKSVSAIHCTSRSPLCAPRSTSQWATPSVSRALSNWSRLAGSWMLIGFVLSE